LPYHINFLKHSNIDKLRTLWVSWPGTSHGSLGVSSLWCLDRVERWRTRNAHDKHWHWKVHVFDHLVHFWNPQSICIDERYEIQVSVLLLTCYSGYPAKICSSSRRKTLNNILLRPDNARDYNSRLSSEKIESAKAQRVPHPPYSPDQT
jgi:hypothetical protein